MQSSTLIFYYRNFLCDYGLIFPLDLLSFNAPVLFTTCQQILTPTEFSYFCRDRYIRIASFNNLLDDAPTFWTYPLLIRISSYILDYRCLKRLPSRMAALFIRFVNLLICQHGIKGEIIPRSHEIKGKHKYFKKIRVFSSQIWGKNSTAVPHETHILWIS